VNVRLAMLARDEEANIADVAEAVGDLVDDYVVLVDHRSSDDTEGAIERELGTAGRIVQFRFRDFADARNQLFHHARPGADYLLLVDPDSPPRGALPADLGAAAAWSCTWRDGALDWHLPILVRADADCRYEGAVHELLVGVSPVWTPSLKVEVKPKPERPERAAEFVEMLRPGAERGEPRDTFYLARTLKGMGRVGEAIEWYLRRAQMGDAGWVEETFLCLLDAGQLLIQLDVELARSLLERASEYRPGRLEPLYWLAWIANWEGNAKLAQEIALVGATSPLSTDALFVNRWMERHGMVEQLNAAQKTLATTPTILESSDGEPVRS
jgi:hypothetical protein